MVQRDWSPYQNTSTINKLFPDMSWKDNINLFTKASTHEDLVVEALAHLLVHPPLRPSDAVAGWPAHVSARLLPIRPSKHPLVTCVSVRLATLHENFE